ncbi:osmoprotectant transport activator ProQ [Escherichia coli]|uniref:osmoprotectant transport activator ProQ n=1 Tax=Escherichia coli TaxID=562 RepID=UPI001BA44B10|nr:osmoprotectant transport activator ProQ [Escherichia coli]QUR52035.1 osmoprotectant transport activator ProQ [Escherichia coli]
MVTLTINRKPQGIFSKSPATPLQDKTNTAHNVKARERIPQLNDKQSSCSAEKHRGGMMTKTPA